MDAYFPRAEVDAGDARLVGVLDRRLQQQERRPTRQGARPGVGNEGVQLGVGDWRAHGRLHQGLSTIQSRWESTAQAATKPAPATAWRWHARKNGNSTA